MTFRPIIQFKPVDPKGDPLQARLGEGYVVPTAAGGWSTTARDRRTSTTDYTGVDPISMDIPILFDKFADDGSVENDCQRLYNFMRRRVGKREEPRIIELRHFPVPFHGQSWVINNITPGDEIRRPSDAHRTRAAFIVTVVEYIAGDVITKGSPAKKHKQKNNGNSKTRTYTVKNGDTLQKIAAKLLGKAKEWHKIADLNNIRDPKHIKVGQKLKVPADE